MKRIHIVGNSPRSGTTLMKELMVNCFVIDGCCDHEMSIFEQPAQEFRIFCSKKPKDVLYSQPLLMFDQNLWIIFMQRDPRDIVVSIHDSDPDEYWTTLGRWREYQRAADKARNSKRFMAVRYEDLVTAPAQVQNQIVQQMPFLVKRAEFADYPKMLKAPLSDKTLKALGGIRPMDTESLGSWRRHKPRLAAQLGLYGDITKELIGLGYESNDTWLQELAGVTPENHKSRLRDMGASGKSMLKRKWNDYKNIFFYLWGMFFKKGGNSQKI